MTKSYPVRMYLKTYRKIKRIVSSRKNETTADYFERVVNVLEGLANELRRR